MKDIVDGTYGILSSGEDDWNDYLQEIKDRKWAGLVQIFRLWFYIQ